MVDFVDSSVLVGAYFHDEPHHRLAHDLVFSTTSPVLCSDLARIECTAAFRYATRAGRITDETAAALDDQLARDLGPDGTVIAVRSDLAALVERAIAFVGEHPIRTLDALHLAAADTDGRKVAGSSPLRFVTADVAQGVVARTLSFEVVTLFGHSPGP